MKRAFNLHFLALLFFWACTSPNSSKVGTVLIIDSIYVASFERNGVVMKYMSDEGEPNVIAIHRGLDKIILNARRHDIELAFQSDNTLTRYFFINQGDSALLTEFEDEIGVDVLSRECLPFDENFKTKYNALLRNDVTGVDEFYRASALVNEAPAFNRIDDTDLGEHLLSLKKAVMEAIFAENRFIDSLTTHELMSPDVATMYQLKNAFDSLKISRYQGSRPDGSVPTFLEPFKAMSHTSLSNRLSWIHLTFYDDWLDMYIKRLKPKTSAGSISLSSHDSLRMAIQNLHLSDPLIKTMLLRKASIQGIKNPKY